MAGRLGGLRALPGAADIERWAASHRQADAAVGLLAVADPAQVLWTCGLLRVADEVGAGDMVAAPKLAAAQAGEAGLCAGLWSAGTLVPWAIRWRRVGTASSPANTCANMRPRRSRITTTTRRLPDRVSDRRRSIRSATRFSGRAWPPT